MGETSESIRKRVQAARNIQQQRFVSSQSDVICNADMRVEEIRQFCKLQDEGVVLSLSKHQSLMRAATSCCAWHSTIYQHVPIIAS
jgi:predicted ATPase with chaperone activity